MVVQRLHPPIVDCDHDKNYEHVDHIFRRPCRSLADESPAAVDQDGGADPRSIPDHGRIPPLRAAFVRNPTPPGGDTCALSDGLGLCQRGPPIYDFSILPASRGIPCVALASIKGFAIDLLAV